VLDTHIVSSLLDVNELVRFDRDIIDGILDRQSADGRVEPW
jgi:hypothetical protein